MGAPCNHGKVEPPESKLVTFPALSCDELLCVYADETEEPAGDCDVGQQGNITCNRADPSRTRFECVPRMLGESRGSCRLRIDYVLERSMCSKRCDADDDCKDGGVGNRVLAENTTCSRGFKCARIQALGEFCCQKLCVCEDDLGSTVELDNKCFQGTQERCCTPALGEEDIFTPSDACFKP